jgi:hypothetical protein
VFSGSSNSSNRSVQAPGFALVASIVGVLVYTLLIGFLLLGERVAPERAYLFIALPCLVPAIWYLSGFLRADGNDTGLVVSSIGWFLVALALFSKHMTIQAALGRGLRPDQISDSAATWIFSLLAIAGLVGGAVLSSRYWMSKTA